MPAAAQARQVWTLWQAGPQQESSSCPVALLQVPLMISFMQVMLGHTPVECMEEKSAFYCMGICGPFYSVQYSAALDSGTPDTVASTSHGG